MCLSHSSSALTGGGAPALMPVTEYVNSSRTLGKKIYCSFELNSSSSIGANKGKHFNHVINDKKNLVS